MDEQFTQYQPPQQPASAEPTQKTKYWKFAAGFLAIIIIAAGGFFVWNKYFSPAAKLARQTQENYQKYLDWQKNYETAMKNDTFGGKTPEETLTMFIDALKKGDVELASKYFALNTNEKSEYYLTTREWEEALKKAEDEGKVEDIIKSIEKTKPVGYSKNYSWNSDSFSYEYLNKDGLIEVFVDLVFNNKSGVWKIESM